MLRSQLIGLCVALVIVLVALSDAKPLQAGRDEALYQKRQASMSEQVAVQVQSWYDPVGAAKKVLTFPCVTCKNEPLWSKNNNISGTGDDQQVPWARHAYFSPNPWPIGVDKTGYFAIPKRWDMFKLNRSFTVEHKGQRAVAPFYVNADYNPETIERAVFVWPGQWRNSWVYANLMGNAYRIAQQYSELNVHPNTTLIVAPTFLNELDLRLGSVKENEVSYKGTGWSMGGLVHHPKSLKGASSFEVVDQFIEMLTDSEQFPNMKKVVMVGHSLGAQATQRYALLAKPKSYESKLKFWIGDPGAWVWTEQGRTNITSNLTSSSFDWPYGFKNAKKVPAFARHRAHNGGRELIDVYHSRKIHYAFALNDNGPGNTHDAPEQEGPNRISRSAAYIVALGSDTDLFKKHHTVDFVPGISHQDYPMLAYYGRIKSIFSL